MQYSYSRIDCFSKCKFKYKMRYVDRVKTIDAPEADNALILGTAVHTGIEQSLEAALKQYAFSFPILTDQHINEIMKLEAVIPKAKAAIPKGGQFEVPICGKDFTGFIDYLVPVGKGLNLDNVATDDKLEEFEAYDLYDFKYTGNPANYRKSPQLSLYKYFFEKYNPGKIIRNMYFLIVPKVQIRQKKTETLFDFRNRLNGELEQAEVKAIQTDFNIHDVLDFLLEIKAATEETDFPKTESYLCRYCEFEEYCTKGWSYFMKLPENKRRSIDRVTKRVIWIYGAPFSGKTTFANGFPDPLMLNTDGNIKFVDAPYIYIKDEVKVEGRMTKRTFAWEKFKDIVAELEKKDNTFKTIVVDLLEDLYEHCRLYMYQQLGISHESDDSFRAWDKVRGEFLNTLKRLMNLDYENIILISHEDMTKDITKKSGDKITAIKPNLQDKVATKVAGMVDVVARIVADGDTRTFCFKSNEVIFGGGRLKVDAKDIPLDVDALFEVYDEANKNAVNGVSEPKKPVSKGRKGKNVEKDPPTGADATPVSFADPVKEVKPEGEKAPEKTADGPTEGTPEEADLPKCPDADRIFKQHEDSNGEIPLCKNIDKGHYCYKKGGPDSCALLVKPSTPEPEEATSSDTTPPRRKRKARD